MSRTVLLFFFVLASSQIFAQNLYDPELEALLPQTPFPFGVASGDPQPDGVVLWTKLFVEDTENQPIEWLVAKDSAMQDVVRSGVVEATGERAFTVKIFADKLQPGRTYFYCFVHEGRVSPIGRTKTAPDGSPEKIRLAVASCSDYRSGYFNAYGHLARRSDIDAVLHLGDYIYEYGNKKWGPRRQRKTQFRRHLPDHTLRNLQDYRTRYGQYRLDPQLQECHRLHPFITVWDDHEIANDLNASFADVEREAAARQAYFEWLPVRDNPERSIVRHFTFGKLAELWMLDGRLEGRSPQARGVDDPDLESPERTMLGKEQTDWLLDGMAASTAQWKIMGNQVIFSPLHDSKVFSRTPKIRMDRWDGYPAERRRIFDFFDENDIQNVIVVTGDVHTAWAFELTAEPLNPEVYDCKTGKGVFGAEFVSPSLTSFNFDEVVPGAIAVEAKRRFKRKKHNPHLRFLDLTRHGYFTLTLTEEEARADWYFIKTKMKVNEKISRRRSRAILAGEGSITK